MMVLEIYVVEGKCVVLLIFFYFPYYWSNHS